jgi:hypothetical protein
MNMRNTGAELLVPLACLVHATAICSGCGTSGGDQADGGRSASGSSGGQSPGPTGGSSGSTGSSSGGAGSGGSGVPGRSSGSSSGSSGDSGGRGNGSSSSSGAPGDSGPSGQTPSDGGLPPFVATGSPITAPDGTWTWVDFPDTSCRDGSTSGLAVSLQSASNKVMIYMEGGGACFDSLTCATNPSNASGQKAQQTAGLFDRTNTSNPVKDWNLVYIPYCTGDIHSGTLANGMVSGVGAQKFVGRLNLEAFFQRLVPTFHDATQVLFTGVSAGGFSASTNIVLAQRAFSWVKLATIDDSGPPMSSMYLPSCLQDKWRATWGFDGSFLKDCGAACPDHSNYALDFAKFVSTTFPGQTAGLIDTINDAVITAFYGYGQNNCTGSLLTPVSQAHFTAGLQDFRTFITGIDPTYGTYYINGSQHTWLGGASLYNQSTGGVALIDWVTKIVNGTSVSQVGP